MAIFRLEREKTIVMLDFTTFNLSKFNISSKKVCLNVRTKFYLGMFELELEKAPVLWFFTSAPSKFFKQNVVQK